LCFDDLMVVPRVAMLCETCAEKVQENLSRKTRDRMGDFRNDVLDLCPDELSFEPFML
jgi:hypothetical protein